MSKMLALYFAALAIYEAVAATFGLSAHRTAAISAIVEIVVWFVLAVGLFRKYHAARMLAVLVCAVYTCTGLGLWCVSGFQHHVILITAVIFGVPLVGLLHPKARSECVRSLRVFGRPSLTQSGTITVKVNLESVLGAGITAFVGLSVAAFVLAPSPIDHLVFAGISGLLSFVVLQIMFRLRSVKTSDWPVRRLLIAATIFAVLAFVSAAYLMQHVFALRPEQ